MANLFVWLLAAIGPLAKKALVAIGIGWVSYAGITALLDVVKGHVITQWGAVSGVTAQVLGLFGFGQALGITLGALAALAGLLAVQKLGRVGA